MGQDMCVAIRLPCSYEGLMRLETADGPIMSLKLGTQDMIVLNEDQVVRDLVDKRSGSYSGRMDVFIREFGEDLNILMKEYQYLPAITNMTRD